MEYSFSGKGYQIKQTIDFISKLMVSLILVFLCLDTFAAWSLY